MTPVPKAALALFPDTVLELPELDEAEPLLEELHDASVMAPIAIAVKMITFPRRMAVDITTGHRSTAVSPAADRATVLHTT
ncbi:MAG TPA: hypothetical protein VEJ87_12900 [Acidimicrobiales bacterium]|nr:hypothetical protein [Acidimicrobiales bacterium]